MKVTLSSIEKEIELVNDKIAEIEDELLPPLENKKADIEEKAWERESGENTEKEQEKIEKIENLISSLEELKETYYTVIENLEELQSTLED